MKTSYDLVLDSMSKFERDLIQGMIALDHDGSGMTSALCPETGRWYTVTLDKKGRVMAWHKVPRPWDRPGTLMSSLGERAWP